MGKYWQNIMNCSQKYKSLPAFTLLELLIGMLLSGIVLSATFSAYRIISKEAELYRVQTKSASELSFFISHFHSDFHLSEQIISSGENVIHLKQKNRELIYRFSPEFVLRSDQEHTDTFYVSVTNAGLFFQGEKVLNGEEADEIQIRIKEGKENLPVNLKKRNSSRELLKSEIEKYLQSNGN